MPTVKTAPTTRSMAGTGVHYGDDPKRRRARMAWPWIIAALAAAATTATVIMVMAAIHRRGALLRRLRRRLLLPMVKAGTTAPRWWWRARVGKGGGNVAMAFVQMENVVPR